MIDDVARSKIVEIVRAVNNNGDYVVQLSKKLNKKINAIACGGIMAGVSILMLYAVVKRIDDEVYFLQNKVYDLQKEIEEMR